MTKPGKIVRKDTQPLPSMDATFDDFRREMESMMMRPWPWSGMWHLPREENRMLLCDMADKGDRYELQMEVPGIEKEKIDVKATTDAIEVSGRQSNEVEEKRRDYVYQERSRRSFYRKIPLPDEVEPSKISAKMTNGVLVVDLPKKASAKSRQSTKVEVK